MVSSEQKRNLKGKFGPTSLTESGDYGSITSNGPFNATESFTVESLKINGPSKASQDVVVHQGTINGPAVFGNDLTVNENFKVNGPLTVRGNLLIVSQTKVNGPAVIDGDLHGKSSGLLKINGPLKAKSVHSLEKVLVRGPAIASEFTQLIDLKIMGYIETENIQAKDVTILLSGNNDSIIKSIDAEHVEIGTELDDEFFSSDKGFFGHLIKRFVNRNPGYAEIDEIRCSGVVEIDHVKVKKVIARELFVGEETEVGEFVEIKEQ